MTILYIHIRLCLTQPRGNATVPQRAAKLLSEVNTLEELQGGIIPLILHTRDDIRQESHKYKCIIRFVDKTAFRSHFNSA